MLQPNAKTLAALASASIFVAGCIATEDGEEAVVVDEAAAGTNLLKNGEFELRHGIDLPDAWTIEATDFTYVAALKQASRSGVFGLFVEDSLKQSSLTIKQVVKAPKINLDAPLEYELEAWTRQPYAGDEVSQRLNASCLDEDKKLIKDGQKPNGYRFQYKPPAVLHWTTQPSIHKFFSCPKGTKFIRVAIVGSTQGVESRDWDSIILRKK
jgi:hypothetical protein